MATKKTAKNAPAKRRKRRKSVGSMTGKFENRTISVKPLDLLYIAGGTVLNYMVINPAINKVSEKLTKEDGSAMLGEHQGKILTAAKGLASGGAAYFVKDMPKPLRLGLVGISAASGIELAGQLIPERMVALNGTGDLFSNVGATPMIEIPVNDSVQLLDSPGNKGGLNLQNDTALYGMDVALYGTGDLFGNDF